MIDTEIAEFLAGVVGVVEANTFEKTCLWREHTARGRTWRASTWGIGRTIGKVGKRPVHVSLLVDEVDGHRILFIDPTSQVVDHQQIERWLIETLPASAKRDGGRFPNRVDAMNFHNVFPR